MERYLIQGGRPLTGGLEIPAAKNSVLPLMAAALLCSGPVTLAGAPRLGDVETSCRLLEALGGQAQWVGSSLKITQPGRWKPQLPARLAQAMRSSVFYLAPLLARTGQVTLPMPGGCRLGPRQIDIHLEGLCRMGARLHWHGRQMTLLAPEGLRGAEFTLRLPSVGATETLLMAAVTAKGSTLLRGVACEPEVEDLANFLNACGGKIKGAGGPVIQVEGVPRLAGRWYRPMADRVAAATYGAAVAIAGGRIALWGCPAQADPFFRLLEEMGCRVERTGTEVRLERTGPLTGRQCLRAEGYPGFPTDMLPLAAAVLLMGRGYSRLTDTLFANRFSCAAGFKAMGAKVYPRPGGLILQGGLPLYGSTVVAPDLRGGAALMLAALGCRGTTTLLDPGHISRGYPDLAGELTALGASVTRTGE